MTIARVNWQEVECAKALGNRCLLHIGLPEQHSNLSLCVDSILPERVATEAASPLDVPVFPVMPHGLAPDFTAYPDTITLRL